MKTTCPHCKKGFDISIKSVLEWIRGSEKLRAAVKSLIARLNRAESSPESQRRNVDYAELARKSHAKRRENKESKISD